MTLWRPGLMQQPSEKGKWGLMQCFHLTMVVGEEVCQCASVCLFVCVHVLKSYMLGMVKSYKLGKVKVLRVRQGKK